MDTIQVTKYPVQTVEHFDASGKSLGFLNEQENLDLRAQIAEQRASGYYLKFNELEVGILPNGKIHDWPNGLYDTNEKLLARIFKAQRWEGKL